MTDSGRDHQGQLRKQLYVHCSLMVMARQENRVVSANLADWPRQGSNPGPTGFEANIASISG